MSISDPDNSMIELMLSLLHETADMPPGNGGIDAVKRHAALQMRNFIDEIPGGFLIYRADDGEQIIYANKALLRIFKCDSFKEFSDITGGSFRGLVHADDIDRVEQEIKDQIADDGDNMDYVEYRIVRKDGIVRWVEDYGHYVSDTNAGDFFYVFITDATERIVKRMVEQATLLNDKKHEEQKLQSLIEEYDKERKLIRQEHLQRLEVIEGLSVNYDSIVYADIDKNIALPYRLSTRLVRQFTKKLETRDLRWFLDDYVKVWVHPDDREYVAEHTTVDYIKSALRDKQTYYINYRCIQNGETQYIQLRLVNVSDGGKVSQIVMGYRNVDEEVKQQMRQKQLLESALNKAKIAEVAKSSFLSNMSHDMRTPLNAIFGYIELARKAAPKGVAGVMRYLDKIEAAGNQILELVEKVLELSYTESQSFVLNETPCSILDLLGQVYGNVRTQADNKQIALTLHIGAIRHPDVIADQSKLSQILLHVIGNAVKYTEPHGAVDITVTEKGKTRDLITYAFEVKDTGIGISEAALARIFEPFERENNTTESGLFGSGLGLTIAKQLAECMNGSIVAQSTPSVGSTFTVTVGLRPCLPQSLDADDEEFDEIDISDKKILIVEDNAVNLEIESELLRDEGFVVFSAENGKAAVDMLSSAKSGDYDLILMDIQMPKMDGRAATRAIRALPDPDIATLPIIALSANAFETDVRESLDAGMDAHLTKPIDMPVLLDAIKTALKNKLVG